MRDAGAPPPSERDLADPLEIRSSPKCYHNKFRHYRPNHLGVRRVSKYSGDAGQRPLGLWVAKPVKKCSFHHVTLQFSRLWVKPYVEGPKNLGKLGSCPLGMSA